MLLKRRYNEVFQYSGAVEGKEVIGILVMVGR
jgi:hypothetical protein